MGGPPPSPGVEPEAARSPRVRPRPRGDTRTVARQTERRRSQPVVGEWRWGLAAVRARRGCRLSAPAGTSQSSPGSRTPRAAAAVPESTPLRLVGPRGSHEARPLCNVAHTRRTSCGCRRQLLDDTFLQDPRRPYCSLLPPSRLRMRTASVYSATFPSLLSCLLCVDPIHQASRSAEGEEEDRSDR